MPITNYLPSSRLIQPGVCTSSTRPASPFEGQAIFETDTDRLLIWNGTTWVMPNQPSTNPPGLEFIRTTTFSGSATFYDVDNIFSSLYKSYKVSISIAAPANFNTGWIQYLDSNGTNVSASYYGSVYGQDFTSASTSFQTASTTGVQYIGWLPNATNSYQLNSVFDLHNPAIAVPTNITGQFTGINAGSAFLGGQVLGIHTGATVMRGLRIANSQGATMTGSISVYGYRQ